MVDPGVGYAINYPKSSTKDSFAFSQDGFFLAVLQARVENSRGQSLQRIENNRDYLGIYTMSDNGTWTQVSYFVLDLEYAKSLHWSPDGSSICVVDSEVEYKVCLYDLFGKKLASYQAYYGALGRYRERQRGNEHTRTHARTRTHTRTHAQKKGLESVFVSHPWPFSLSLLPTHC